MSGFMKRSEQNVQKPFPGCMGSMINIFDLSAGMAGTKLLTEIPHSDGSTTMRNHSVLLKKLPDVVNHTVDKQSVNGQRRSPSNMKPTATLVKKLIEQEMRKESKQRQKSPTVVARLMGLDSLPMQQSVANDRQNVELDYSYNGSAGGGVSNCRHQEDTHFNNQVAFAPAKKEYKDVHEIWQQPSRSDQTRDHSTQKEIYDENTFQKRMTLVRQKFMEAKRLAKDEKLLKSKEFQDAIEVLSSNRDLFLKFLEEPNSLFSKHHLEHRSVSPPPPRRITVLKPATTVELKSEKAREKQLHEVSDEIVSKTSQHHRSCSFPGTRLQELPEPTRIVVLKPSPAKLNDAEAVVAPSVPSPKPVDGQGSLGSLHTKEVIKSRELAKEITRRMRESLSGQIRDGDILTSFLCNGYISNDRSFNKTESECIEEEVGSQSDSDIASPISQHSWDFLNRIRSSHSVSSLSLESHSPESSVVAEAKKRLSERLALVASNLSDRQQRIERKNSRTLGEMLAIPAIKKEENNNDSSIEVVNEVSPPDLGSASRLLSPGFVEDECSLENSPRSLARSKSVPVSSFAYEAIESHVGFSNPLISGPIIQTDVPKSKNVKLSFTGKLSSFFLSKNKKKNREDTTSSSSQNYDVIQPGHGSPHCKASEGSYHVNGICTAESGISPDKKASCLTVAYDCANQKALPLEKLSTCENCTQNLNEPSPISVLEAPFKDDITCSRWSPENVITGHPQALSRSPPIESVARSLIRAGPYLETSSLYALKPSKVLSKVDEEQEHCMIVKKLISSSGFSDNKSSFVFAKWYSLEIPLNPMILDEYIYSKDEEASCRERRSCTRLMFDCTNAALLGISLKEVLDAYPWGSRIDCGALGDGIPDASLSEEVCGIIRNWSSGENFVPDECSNISIVVEMMAKKEVTGRQWSESMWLERYEFSKEISWRMLEELVEEALSEFINDQ